jgi:hypothetical protein
MTCGFDERGRSVALAAIVKRKMFSAAVFLPAELSGTCIFVSGLFHRRQLVLQVPSV